MLHTLHVLIADCCQAVSIITETFVLEVTAECQLSHVLLHSAGVGRTGTFITIDAMMERLKKRDDLNIFGFVTEMRTRRMKMVQTLVS